jgi:2-oxoglutarate/2-oxoacid ferredoxin oxidoreductase subunit alpha
MDEISILIGGKAGFGIDKSSLIIGGMLARLGYRLYVYRDYPSIIRGGHTFSIIRASDKKIACHKDRVDVILALNQDTIDIHRQRIDRQGAIIYDSDSVKAETLPEAGKRIGLPLMQILKEENTPEIMRNSGMVGALAKALGIDWNILDGVFRKNFPKTIDTNLKISRIGYDKSEEFLKVPPASDEKMPLCTGNEATAMGFIKAGIDAYIAYPMTPSSPILHSMANLGPKAGFTVLHPESEIAVILMAAGFAYCGKKAAVGTSGGGFCLMTEGLSFSAMAELPVVIVLGQRPGPSTGLPTYSSQTELHFALRAGHGEFLRFVTAPGDAEEAYYWSQVALNISSKYQIPSIILTDKNMGEGTFSFQIGSIKEVKEEKPLAWDGKGEYKRYLDTPDGVSPMAPVPLKNVTVKVNSYEHDESGITTEDPAITRKMQEKRFRKGKFIVEEMNNYECVKVHGNNSSSNALICWGSAKGVAVEVAQKMGLKAIQVCVLSPFPDTQLKKAMQGVNRLIDVENNMTAQLAALLKSSGIEVNKKILKYDGRPFSLEELEARVKEALV